jgi:hypothetical protein
MPVGEFHSLGLHEALAAVLAASGAEVEPGALHGPDAGPIGLAAQAPQNRLADEREEDRNADQRPARAVVVGVRQQVDAAADRQEHRQPERKSRLARDHAYGSSGAKMRERMNASAQNAVRRRYAPCAARPWRPYAPS